MNVPDKHNRQTLLYHRREAVAHRGLLYHHHEIHALFDELIHKPWGASCWNPPVDIWENAEAYTIEMDLPGVQPDRVEIQVQGRTLTIIGRRERKEKTKETSARLHERCEGRFSRAFEFDFGMDEETIEKHWQDGVLTLIVPKSKNARFDHG
jgi:HSP20 family molecular chaperone IbpA